MKGSLFDIEGKIALVTGSSQGLGLSMATALGKAGASVVLNGRNKSKLDKAVKELLKQGIKAHSYLFDVSDKKQVSNAVEEIEDEVGGIDILVNNAGVQKRALLEDFKESDWDEIIRINLKGVFLVSQCVARGMIARKSGKIINICSMQSELARPTIGPYAASKGGVKMLTKSMAAEWMKYNIQVNGIGPGYFLTEMTRSMADKKEFDAWLKSRTPANRWGRPEELNGALIFLSSEASSYVNGHILYVDGGLSGVV